MSGNNVNWNMFICSDVLYCVLNMTTSTIDESIQPDQGTQREPTTWRPRILPRIQPVAFYLSLALAGIMAVLFLPELLATLVTGFTAEAGAELGIHRLHIMGIVAVVGVFLLGVAVQVYQPQKKVAAMWGAFLVILTVSIGTVAYGVGRPEEVLPFLTVTTIALISHPAGRNLLRRGRSYSPALLGMLAIAAVPIAAFVVSQQTLTLAGDEHAIMGHYVMMTGLMIAPFAYGIFAALGFTGWRLAAYLAGLPMAYYGILSIAFPAQPGSTGVLWGAAAIVWAVVFVAIAEYSRRTDSRIFRRDVKVRR